MYIESALAGVPEEELCPGWKTSKCTAGSTGVDFTCPECGVAVKASSDAFMKEVIDAHKQVGDDGLVSALETHNVEVRMLIIIG